MSVDLSSVFPPAPDELGNMQAHPDLVRYLAGELTPSKEQAEKIAQLVESSAWAHLRARRNALLAASDWTQLGDSPANAGAWAKYRQALRDLPASSSKPESVKWPVAP